jgi:anhydro-N-acetylmuramic acid kinase
MTSQTMRAIGLMSGTSLDGVDVAWLETDGHAIQKFGPTATLHYEDTLRGDLRRLLDLAPTISPDDPFLKDVEKRLTQDHAIAVGLVGLSADVIGFHGQTILHAPERHRTWQIGGAALLAHICRIPIVHDFRSADVAAGGQGAPFAPLFHAAMAASLPKPLLVINIGGVANLTWIGEEEGQILACDSGPGNGPLDDLAQKFLGQPYDKDGALAASGTVDEARLATLLAHPYFAKPAPKSLDRLTFSSLISEATANLVPADAAATLAAFSVAAIAQTPLPAAPLRVLVCGGGRKNPVLMAGLAQAFNVPVEPAEDVGWDGDALEAQCFAFLAVRSLKGLPLSLPTTTGVAFPMTGGVTVSTP